MKRFRLHALTTVLVLLSALAAVPAAAQDNTPLPEALPDIPYQKFVLDNGLTVIVHEDRKAPIVAVNVWYHVGSKNEPEGRSGFAHLFEHLMFNGSENFNDDYFQSLERVGATDLNGTTNEDRTNYFQNVPTNALDLALWMESDRMGHLLGAIDVEKLDEQRGVVQNEKRQGENQPYGQVNNLIVAATYPKGHPYAHTVIGSMDDLNAAELDDVKEWFKTYYGPNNAVVAIAGDIDAETALDKANQYFGDIPPGPPIAHFQSWVAKRTGEQRQVLQDRVPQARVYKVWNVPEEGTREAALLDLATDLIASGKNSRLYKRLVYEDQIATDIGAFLDSREIGSQVWIWATARPGQDLDEVEAVVDEEMARFLAEGPTQRELDREQTGRKASFVRGIERIGGFGGKSDILARSEVYTGSPDGWRENLTHYLTATAEDVREVAAAWLSDGVFVLEVHPFPELSSAEEGADRTNMPAVDEPPLAQFPAVQRAELSNGLKVVLAERHAAPLVEMTLSVNAGSASDATAIPGTAALAMNMLDEGTRQRSALEISEELDMLGGSLGAGSNLDMSVVSMSALKENLAETADLFAEVILEPSFPENELERLRKQQIAGIQRERVNPVQMALRVFPQLLYGEGHAYALPFTGSGTEASVSRISRDDLQTFHQTWFKPNNATLVVAGDITMDEARPILEERFGRWRAGDVPSLNIATVDPRAEPAVYLMDRPGSQQSIIFAGHVAPPTGDPDAIAIETMNTVLGGAFTSRVNMNLREDKGWSYGAFTILIDARGQRPFIVYAPVQTDKTAESMAEALRELEEYVGDNPATDDEVARAQSNQTLALAGQWETVGAVEGSLNQLVRFGYPDDYWQNYAQQVRALNKESVAAAARKVVKPGSLAWIVVGDRAVIEEGIRALNIGPLYHIDADGNLLDGGTN